MKRCCECGRPLEDDCIVRDFGEFCSGVCLARFRGDWDCEEEEYERTEDDEY